MAKQILYGEEARRSWKAGIDALTDAVKVTRGPKGRPVALDKKFGPPSVINDGVSIDKDIELKSINVLKGGSYSESLPAGNYLVVASTYNEKTQSFSEEETAITADADTVLDLTF